MRKLLPLALGWLLLCCVAAQADSLYLFNGSLITNVGDRTVTGQFTWDGSGITAWDLDFSQLQGTCGVTCGLGGMPAFTSLGNGYELAGSASDLFAVDPGHNSYFQVGGVGLINFIGQDDQNNALYSAGTWFSFDAIPGAFDTDGGLYYFAVGTGNFASGYTDDKFMWRSGTAELAPQATPEPASLVFTLTGGLLLLAGFVWHERRKHTPDLAA